MYRLRNARPEDRPGLLELARILNTLNLPPDEAVVRELLERSERAFQSDAQSDFDPERHWTFVLEDPSGAVVGTSALHAQHGTPASPHTFFRVEHDECCTRLQGPPSRVLYRKHRVLRLARTFEGPTEVGGLVLNPACRGLPGKLGTLLSLGRFLFVACRRALFRPRMLAEVLPPLSTNARGEPTSPLWDALGANLTGLSYDDADKLSRTHVDLIPHLFPHSKIITSLLPAAAQAVIGEVGDSSKGAAHLLYKIGFVKSNEVDPFDGGPHLHAESDKLAPLARGRWASVQAGTVPGNGEFALLAHDFGTRGEFRAVRAPIAWQGKSVVLGQDAREALELGPATGSDRVWVWNERALA